MDFLKITDFSKEKIKNLIGSSISFKQKEGTSLKSDYIPLSRKHIGLFFERPSTRTRISMSVAVEDLGATPHQLDEENMQLKRGEAIEDTAKVLSRYFHGMAARALEHESIERFANNSDIPVVNAMSSKFHPCQALADLHTIKEYKKTFSDTRLAWIGDGNNVCSSIILGGAVVGMDLIVATPKGYEPEKSVLDEASKYEGNVEITNDPKVAAEGADALYTDVWVSTGYEDERAKRESDFEKFTVNKNLLELAKDDSIVMHCMPIEGEEIDREVVEGPNSVIYDQAENRLHTAKALFAYIF